VPEASLYDIPLTANDGTSRTLRAYAGKALLLVNTASECGYTPQYAGLQALYERYRDRGLEVLGFPSNDFGAQEPGTDAEIRTFCETRYRTTFPLFSKLVVKGPGKHPLYQRLTHTPGMEGEVRWNFNKFLVDPSGAVVARFDSKVDPLDNELLQQIEDVLPAGR
jgi:glutathione peroxidase